MANREIDDKYIELIDKFLVQLKEFEQAYGYIPKCQLVISEDYKKLVDIAMNRKQS